MFNQLNSAISALSSDHPLVHIKQWHLRQIIRQMKLRGRKAKIPPFSNIEEYRGQGWIVSKLYALLVSGNKDKLQEFLSSIDYGDIRKLMWQRFTSSSFTSREYFLPTLEEMEEMVTTEHLDLLFEQIQSQSCEEGYWDVILEEAELRSKESGRAIILEVLDFFSDEFTWWNTYQIKKPILELRDPSGHGLRFDLEKEILQSVIEPDEDGIIFTMSQ